MYVITVRRWEPIVTEIIKGRILYTVISGVTAEEEKWRYCVTDTNSALSFAVGAMYVRETFQGDSKASVSSVVLLHTVLLVVSNLPCIPASFK